MAQLQDLFQTHAIVKILDFLTLYKEFEYTRTDIANETGISRRTLYQIWPFIERFELVKMTKSSGMVKFYKLNTENPISKHLVALADQISLFEAERIAGAESVLTLPTNQVESLPIEPMTLTVTKSVTTWELKARGTSEVQEIFQKSLELKNEELSFPLSGFTGLETVIKKKQSVPSTP